MSAVHTTEYIRGLWATPNSGSKAPESLCPLYVEGQQDLPSTNAALSGSVCRATSDGLREWLYSPRLEFGLSNAGTIEFPRLYLSAPMISPPGRSRLFVNTDS